MTWEDVFGKDNVIVVCYIEKNNIIDVLARTLISQEICLHRTSAYARNKSSGASAIEALRLLNKQIFDHQHLAAAKYCWADHLFRIRNAIKK
jgi:hypothetical protein